MASCDPRLYEAFVSRAQAFLAAHPGLEHSWFIDDKRGRCMLVFPVVSQDGFEVIVTVCSREIVVSGKGFHQHFANESDVEAPIEKALGLTRDLLSPQMRLREFWSDGRACGLSAEYLKDGEWQEESLVKLLYRKHFSERDQRLYQNHSLPMRDNP